MPRYEFSEGTSNKFWEIELEVDSFTIRFGKIGTSGQSQVKSFETAAAAKKEYERLIAEKTRKGYVLAGAAADHDDDEETGPPPASNPTLEQAILADLDRPEPYLVYADWLAQKGDPRGELITLQVQGVADKASQLIEKHAKHFYGKLAGAIGSMVTVEWYLGFIRSARIAVGYDDEGGEVGELLDKLLALPSGRFVRELTLGITEGAQDGENSYDDVLQLLAQRKPPALRKLFVGDFEYPDETEISWSHIGNVAPLWKALPQLESLILQSGSMELGAIDAPQLRVFEARTGGFTAASIASVSSARWPNLERLVIWFGSDNYGAEGGVDDIQPILDGRGLAKLKHLGLMNAEFTDDLCRALARSKVLAQLETLNLSMGTMTDDGARAIGEARAAFRHLKVLDLSDNFLTGEAGALLAGIPGVQLGAQREADEYDGEIHRYASVGE